MCLWRFACVKTNHQTASMLFEIIQKLCYEQFSLEFPVTAVHSKIFGLPRVTGTSFWKDTLLLKLLNIMSTLPAKNAGSFLFLMSSAENFLKICLNITKEAREVPSSVVSCE